MSDRGETALSVCNTEKSLTLYDENKPLSSKRKKILDEDAYTEELEKIIKRDFFPDLDKLRAQNEYLEALEKNDIPKLQEILFRYRPKAGSGGPLSSIHGMYNTPASFDTPDIARNSSPPRTDVSSDESKTDASELKSLSLDEFFSSFTSEDNASFESIMWKSAYQHRLKYPWLYKDEEDEQKKITDMLTLPSSEKPLAIEGKESAGPITWAYKNKNSLMYVPDGVEFTAKEKLLYEKRQKIMHDNTRFASPPFDEQANKAAIAEAASVQAKMKEGKVGIDGKEILPDESPVVNGYGFVGTPSPAPGVTDTPIMTWGEIEGTPFRLDGSDTPLPQNPSGQQFKIPEIPAREKIALSLADKVARKHRTKKQITSKGSPNILSPSLKFGSPLTPLERLYSMSPAAQKLACAKLGIHRDTDKALRASYSPSPVRSPYGERTPVSSRTSANNTPVQSSRKQTPGKV